MSTETRQDPSNYWCSCTPDADGRHRTVCRLWMYHPFVEGVVDWDEWTQDFVPSEQFNQAVQKAFNEALFKDDRCYCFEFYDEPDRHVSGCEFGDTSTPGIPECLCNPEKKYHCITCGVIRDKADDAWEFTPEGSALDVPVKSPQPALNLNGGPPKAAPAGKNADADKPKPIPATAELPKTTPSTPSHGSTGFVGGAGRTYPGSTSTYVPKCRHMERPVKFPDGTTVYASSQASQEKPQGIPDFTLYAAESWRPRGIGTYIPWRDYGTPTIPWFMAAGAIIEAFEKAQEGYSVEVGCIGGHGRTGTILACMAILAGVRPKRAVKWVKKHYCNHAVEAKVQEWFVQWFAAFAFGEEAPPPPEVVGFTNSLVEVPDAPKPSYSSSSSGSSYGSSGYQKPNPSPSSGAAAGASSGTASGVNQSAAQEHAWMGSFF